MRCLILLLISGVLCIGISACGQKGALYLPQPQQAPEQEDKAGTS